MEYLRHLFVLRPAQKEESAALGKRIVVTGNYLRKLIFGGSHANSGHPTLLFDFNQVSTFNTYLVRRLLGTLSYKGSTTKTRVAIGNILQTEISSIKIRTTLHSALVRY